MVTEEVAVESEAAMCVVRLRRTELKCLIDLYYRGRTDNELLKTCARALQVGQDRKAPGSVAFKLSSAQRDTCSQRRTADVRQGSGTEFHS